MMNSLENTDGATQKRCMHAYIARKNLTMLATNFVIKKSVKKKLILWMSPSLCINATTHGVVVNSAEN